MKRYILILVALIAGMAVHAEDLQKEARSPTTTTKTMQPPSTTTSNWRNRAACRLNITSILATPTIAAEKREKPYSATSAR